jgi:hypothetical protein
MGTSVHTPNEMAWYRIRLGEVLALRDIPALFEEVRRAAAIGARVVELDGSNLARMTDGARCLLEAAQRRFAAQQVDVRLSIALDATG